jgi:hypothetical protein
MNWTRVAFVITPLVQDLYCDRTVFCGSYNCEFLCYCVDYLKNCLFFANRSLNHVEKEKSPFAFRIIGYCKLCVISGWF